MDVLLADVSAKIDARLLSPSERTKSETLRLLNRLEFRCTLDELDDATIERELGKLSDVPSEQLHAFRALRTMLRWWIVSRGVV
ncbi:hypothetical protein ACTGJ9_039470 [Bradyrhizobium sp. RDM12]